MNLIYKKSFNKGLRKLNPTNRERVITALALFHEDPFDPRLKNHALHGKMEGMRSISAGYDLRILFIPFDGYIEVHLLKVGTHRQIYQ